MIFCHNMWALKNNLNQAWSWKKSANLFFLFFFEFPQSLWIFEVQRLMYSVAYNSTLKPFMYCNILCFWSVIKYKILASSFWKLWALSAFDCVLTNCHWVLQTLSLRCGLMSWRLARWVFTVDQNVCSLDYCAYFRRLKHGSRTKKPEQQRVLIIASVMGESTITGSQVEPRFSRKCTKNERQIFSACFTVDMRRAVMATLKPLRIFFCALILNRCKWLTVEMSHQDELWCLTFKPAKYSLSSSWLKAVVKKEKKKKKHTAIQIF